MMCRAIFFSTIVFAHAMLLAAEEKPGPRAALPPERRPYDVQILIAFDSTSFDGIASQTIIREIDQGAHRCVGDLWTLNIREAAWLRPVNTKGLRRLERPNFEEHRLEGGHANTAKSNPSRDASLSVASKTDELDDAAEPDVIVVVAVEALPVGIRLSVRLWQPLVRFESAVVSRDVADRREVAVEILRMCRDLLRPMGVVEQSSDRSVRIRLRAGELNPPDPSFAQLKTGDVLQPMLAYRDKNNVVERLQPIPWSYVSVDEVVGSTVLGSVQSGLRLALGGKKRGRIDTLVVVLRPEYTSTRIELLTQTKPIVPLVAHRIEVRTEPVIPRPSEEHPEIDPNSTLMHELLTDRRGLTHVPVDPDRRLVWLFAYSGQNLLARVPFVPGIVSEVRLEVPDDATRLTAEADLQMLQGELIDSVALRNTAVATIRAAAKKNDWITVNQKLALLKQQQDVGKFIDRLNAVRVAGTAAAKIRRDKVSEVRINRMCDDSITLIQAHLGEEKVRLLTEEMKSLQQAEASAE